MERRRYHLTTMLRRLAMVIHGFRARARRGSASAVSKEALEARRKAEMDYSQQGGWKL